MDGDKYRRKADHSEQETVETLHWAPARITLRSSKLNAKVSRGAVDGTLCRMGLLEPEKSDCFGSNLGGTTDWQLIRPKERMS